MSRTLAGAGGRPWPGGSRFTIAEAFTNAPTCGQRGCGGSTGSDCERGLGCGTSATCALFVGVRESVGALERSGGGRVSPGAGGDVGGAAAGSEGATTGRLEVSRTHAATAIAAASILWMWARTPTRVLEFA